MSALVAFYFLFGCSGSTPPSDAPGDSLVAIPSEGCGQTPPSGTTFTLNVSGTNREYIVTLPSGYNSQTAYNLVFGFHGNSFTASSFSATQLATSMRTAAGTSAIFVYPTGLDVTGLPFEAAGGVTGTGWDWRPTGRDVAFFDALYAHLRTNYCFDRSHVFTFGRSHGGFFNTTLSCVRSHLFRAAGETSGGYPVVLDGVSCSSPSLPYWKHHNQNDAVVLYSYGTQSRDRWLSENACSTSTTPVSGRPDCVQYTGCESRGALTFCSPASGNHDSPTYAGEDLWSFFALF